MDLPGPIHDFLLVFLGSGLILGSLAVVLLPNPIYSAFSLGLVLFCISLFYNELMTALRTRDLVVPFEELLDKIIGSILT